MNSFEVRQRDSDSRGAVAYRAFLGDGYNTRQFLLSCVWIDGYSKAEPGRSIVCTLSDP